MQKNNHKKHTLVESEKTYRSFFNSMPDGFAYHKVILDRDEKPIDYVFLEVNPAFEKLTGLKKQDVIDKKVTEVIHGIKKDPADWIGKYGEVAITGKEARFEDYSVYLKRWYSIAAYSPRKGYFVVIFNDITARKTVEGTFKKSHDALEGRVRERTAKLTAERKRLIDVLETLPVYVVLLDSDYRVPFANKFFRERFGKSGGKRCFEYLFNRTEPCENCESYKVLKTNKPHHWEWAGPDGRNYDIYDYPFKDADGSSLIMEMGIDITDIKRAQETLKAAHDTLETQVRERTAELASSESRFRALVENAANMVAIIDANATIRYISSNVVTMLGYQQEEIENRDGFDFVHPDDVLKCRKAFGEVIRKPSVLHRVEARGRHKDDTFRWLYIVAQNLLSEPALSGIILNISDITERKYAEDRLRESEKRLVRAQEIAHLGSWELDLINNNLSWSDETYRIFGLKPQEFKATYEAFLEAVHPEDRAAVDAAYSRSLREGKGTYEIEHRIVRRSDGKVRIVHEKCEHIRNNTGEIIRSVGMVHDVTERKLAENKIAHLASFPQLNPNPVIEIDAAGKVTFSNSAAVRVLQQLGAPKQLRLFFPIDFKEILRGLKKRKNKEFLREVQVKDTVFLETAVVLPELGVVRIYARDITNRKLMEDKLRETRDYLEKLIRYANAPIIVWDAKLRITQFNRAFERLTGYTQKDVLGKGLDMLFPEATKNEALEKIRAAMSGEFLETVEISIRCKNKDTRIVLWNSADIYADKDRKKLTAVIAQGQDITERKYAEEELKQARRDLELRVQQRTEQLAQVNKHLSDELVERLRTEKYIRASNSLLKIASRLNLKKEYSETVVKLIKGWTGCSCIGLRLVNAEKQIPYESYTGFSREFWESENWLSIKNNACACIRTVKGKFLACDKPAMTKAGSFYLNDSVKFVETLSLEERQNFRGVCIKSGLLSLAVIPIRYKNEIIGAIHIADPRPQMLPPKLIEFIESLTLFIGEGIQKFDLTDKIRKSSELLERVFSSTNFMIAYLGKDFNFIRVNKAYAENDGKIPEFFIGKNHFDLYPSAENRAIFREVVETGRGYSAFTKPFIYENNSERGISYWDWSLQPVKNEQGQVEGLIFVLVNVTKRKQAEDELVKAQNALLTARRLSDIGTLAATVAHELRNPLAAMRMAAYNIKRKAQNPNLDRHLENIEIKINDSEQIISNLLFYSRLKTPNFSQVNTNKLLNDCIVNVKDRYRKYGTKIKCKLWGLRNITIEADELQAKELFSNILNNAYEAVPEGKGRVEISGCVFDKNSIKVIIKDNGEGIDGENLKRVFEPFFSTKAKGTGLGLAVCRQIVQLHGGTIAIESEKGKGTLVSVTLPIKR